MEIAGYIVLGIVAYAFVLLLSGETFFEVWMSLLSTAFLWSAAIVIMLLYNLLIRGTVLEMVLVTGFGILISIALFGALIWMLIQLCRGELSEENDNPTKPSPPEMPWWEVGFRMAGTTLACLVGAIFVVTTCTLLFT